MSKITLTCPQCSRQFERERGEHNRNIREGRKAYCSNKCSGKDHANFLPDHQKGNTASFKGKTRADEYSPYRWHFRNIKRRHKKECAVTLQDLKEQWEKQKGICPYTGWELKQIKNTGPMHQLPSTPDRASLDRIDSSKGYIKSNIQFVAAIAQYAKNAWDEQELFKFCEAVVDNRCVTL
jgi:hypothetical protein